MVIDFAKVNVKEAPLLILQNLDDTPVGVLKYAFNVEADLCYNEISTLTFDLPGYVDGELTPNYNRVIGMRIIDLKGYGRFLLQNPKENDDGVKLVKACTAYSLEYEFTLKKLALTAGTYNLWNPIAPSGTILGMILDCMPSWKVGSVDASLIDKYRTFDDSGDQNIYNFMKSDLQESYGCVFDFDTYNRVIYVRDIVNEPAISPVLFSMNNLVKDVEIAEDTESIVTSLGIYGAEGVDIRSVNPMGTTNIINLDYFMTLENFSQEMIDKYKSWKQTFQSYQRQYFNLTVEEALKTAQLVTEQAALTTLQGELASLENIQAVIIQGIAQGLKKQSDLNAANSNIKAKKREITTKQSEIETISAAVASLNVTMQSINQKTKLSAFFTEDEYKIVDRYLKEDSISEDSFVAIEVDAFDSAGESTKVSGTIFNLTNSIITMSENELGKDIYSASGGRIECSTSGFVLSANLIRASLDYDTDKNLLFTARLSGGKLNGQSFPSGCVSISGTASSVTSNVKEDTTVGGAISDGTDMSFKVGTADLYFTRSTTEYEQRSVEWDLFDYGVELLEKLAYPAYSCSLDLANFLAMSEFEAFKNKLELGSRLYWQKRDGTVMKPYLVAVHISFENFEDFSAELSSKYSSNGFKFLYTDLFDDSKTAGSTLDAGKWTYSQFVNSGAETSLSKFMKSALDIAKNNIMSTSGQAISWGESGLRFRKWKDGSATEYEPYEIWMNNGSIMFTTDSWNTANLAIGQMVSEDGALLSGVIADSLIGKLLAGNSLIIESTKKDGDTAVFRVDGNGASLHNAVFDIYDGNKVHITLNPHSGIAIGEYPLYTDDEYTIDETRAKFWVDTNGNVHIKGILEGCDGKFSGVVQAQDFLDSNGDSMLVAGTNRFNSDYLDLGNIQIDGETGNITMTGSINLAGDITWSNTSSPVQVLYSTIYLSAPSGNYSSFPSIGSSSWHRSMSDSDYFASYTYDGGISWTAAVRIRGENGSNASVTRRSIYTALLNAYEDDGIYSYNGDILINASAIKTGLIDADLVTLGSYWGGFCCAVGNDGVSDTYGAKMYGSDPDFYFIATNAGVRMQSPNIGFTIGKTRIVADTEIETTSDQRMKHDISYEMSKYDEFFFGLKPSYYKFNAGTSDRYHIGYIAQDVESALKNACISTQDFAGLVQASGVEDVHKAYEDEYSLRYSEFIALNTHMIQKLYQRVDELEKKINSVEV